MVGNRESRSKGLFARIAGFTVASRGVSPCRVATTDHPRGNADHRGVGWHVRDDDGVGPDPGPVPYRDRSQNLGARPDKHIVPDDRGLSLFGANRYLVLALHAAASANAACDHPALGMDQHELGPKLGPAADDTAATNGVDSIEYHLKWDESPSAGPLHEPVPDHGGRAVG